MTAETGKPTALTPEQRESLIIPEDFLRRLYSKSFDWLVKERNAEVLFRFNAENVANWGQRLQTRLFPDDFDRGIKDGEDVVFPEIEDWDQLEGRHESVISSSIELEEAVIMRNQGFDYALVLGKRSASRHLDRALSLQCGYLPRGRYPDGDDARTRLRVLSSRFNHGTVGFQIIQGVGPIRMYIRGFANSSINGGIEVDDTPQRLLTQRGLEESLDLIRDTFTRGHRNPNSLA